MTTKYVPTFLLKGIDPIELSKLYDSGEFVKASHKSNIKISQNINILAPKYGLNNTDSMYCIKDKNNCNIVIATCNHASFETFTKSGGLLEEGGRCMRCTRDIKGIPVAYPIAYKESTVLTDGVYKVLYTFWTEGRFCDFECTLSYVQAILYKPAIYRDTTIRDSEKMLKFLYKLTYPDSGPLRPAPDPILMDTLTDDEWKNESHVYIRTDRILLIPAKVEYVQQNFKSPVIAIDPNIPVALR